MKVAIYTMCRNEADNVDGFVETVRGADHVVITDTGSTDDTPERLAAAGVDVRRASIVPWRFDMATNQALHAVPADVDVCIKLDLDERLATPDGRPWREVLERVWRPGMRRLRYWYTWSWVAPGQPGVRFRTACIHARDGYHWRHPGHAALMGPGEFVDTDELEIHHFMRNKGRPDYLALLRLAVTEQRCPRTLYYLAREYWMRRADRDAKVLFEEYLRHPEARWAAERAEAMRMLGVAHRRLGNREQALSWLIRATAERPNVREIWHELLESFTEWDDLDGAIWAGGRCLAITERDREYITTAAEAWTDRPQQLVAAAMARRNVVCG